MNIKSISEQYILKRWTREARSRIVQDNQGQTIIEGPKLDNMLRYKNMARKFLNLAYRAANRPKCTLLVNNTLDMLSKQVEEEMNGVTSPMDPIIAPTNVTLPNELLSTASLKKKEVETKTSKRKRTWLDKKRKFTKKGGNKKEKSSKVCDKKKKSKVYDKKKEKMFKDIRRQKIYQISLIVSTVKVSIVFNYFILFNLKEQETIQVTVDDGAAAQMPSLPEEGISEQYMAINTFSELLTVIFQSNKPFL